VKPYTIWSPTANNGAPGPVAKYLDPTSGNGGTAGFYSTNLIRALSGGYNWGAIQGYTLDGENNYNALQVSVNRRFSKSFQLGGNYTWSKTLTYNRNQFVNDYLLKNVTSNRPHAVNVNWGYDIPGITKWSNNYLTRTVFNDWHLSGVGTFYYGQPLTINCSANGAPIGYWTGSVANNGSGNTGFPFRCQQNGSLWLPDGTTPSSLYPASNSLSTTDPRLFYPFNPQNFVLPSATSFGIGNTPPTLTYGPGVINFDVAIQKEINIGTEAHPRTLSFKFETYNLFNHFNPGAPNTTLNINCSPVNGSCTTPTNLSAYTSSTFGTVTPTQTTTNGVVFGGAQVQARHASVTLRFRF
jgi:hypothetical protein